MDKEFEIQLNGANYSVSVIYKRIRNVYYRFKDNRFVVTCPRRTLDSQIKSGLIKYGPSLIKRTSTTNKLSYGDNYIYIFGQKYDIPPSGNISFNDGSNIKYESVDDLYKKLKKVLLDYLIKKVRYYEVLMNIKPYNVKVKNMSSRWGSNSKTTRTLNFSLSLISYSSKIIDSVIVHELAHDNMYNHSDKFYNRVYKYCEDYDYLHQCLRKRKYHD